MVLCCVVVWSVVPAAAIRRTDELATEDFPEEKVIYAPPSPVPSHCCSQLDLTPEPTRSLIWPLGMLLYSVFVQTGGRGWSFFRDRVEQTCDRDLLGP